MKRIMIVIFLLVLSVTAAASSTCHNTDNENTCLYYDENNVKIYSLDFTEIYSETLEKMFGSSYTVSGPAGKYMEGEKCDCGRIDERDSEYLEWNLYYKDGGGVQRRFRMTNKEMLCFQIEKYVEDMVSEYMEDNYLYTYTSEYKIPLNQGGNYIFCFLTDITVDSRDVLDKEKAAEEYRKSLEKPESCIDFAKLEMKDIFLKIPVYLSLHISVDADKTSGAEYEQLKERSCECADKIAADINKFTGNTLNSTVSVYLESQNNHESVRRPAYIGGKETVSGIYYEREVFDYYSLFFHQK